MTFRRGLLAVSLCAATTAALIRPARGDATSRPVFDESIRQLGSADAGARETAAAALRNAGRAAEAALRAAAGESKDPEIARRARGLLAGIGRPAADEIEETDPPDVDRYRTADHGSKGPLIDQIGKSSGAGYRAGLLVRLWATEDDDELRSALFTAMLREPAAAASALVARGERPAARRLLDIALAQGNVAQAAEPYVAMCLLDGDLPAAINRWSAPRQSAANRSSDSEQLSDAESNADTIAAIVLSRLRRAAGDARGAVAAARRSGDASLYEEALLGAVEARPQQVVKPSQLGTIAGALHLAGDARGFDDVIARMRKLATPETMNDVAHVLLLCGRADDGLRTLVGSGRDDVELFRLLAAREQFDDAWRLVDARDAVRTEAAMQLRLAAAEQRYALGDQAAAEKLLARVIDENRTTNAAEVHAGLGDLCREMGRGEEGWDHYRDAMKALRGDGPGGGGAGNGGRELAIARRAFDLSSGDDADGSGPDDIRGDELWQLLAWRMQDKSRDERFDRARAIAEGKIPLDELVRLADVARRGGGGGRFAGERVFGDLIGSMHLALFTAQRMKAADGEIRAAQYLADIVDRLSTPELAIELYIRPGDWAAERGDFIKAAEWYGRAWNLDRTRAGALYLRASALGKAGWARRAAELTDLALTIPLGDVYRRYEAVRLLHRRGMTVALSREVDVIRRTTRGDLFPADHATRLAADEAARAGDYLAAAALRERSMLNFMGTYELPEPATHLRLPHIMHGERARGLLAKGDVAAAEREIAICRALLPGDVMLPINVVPELERHGMKARADELYDESKHGVEAVLAKYPNSANDHNNLAWLAANCGRDMEQAMSHAKRAVELKPKNAAYLDTLAEVQYRRGEYDEAIKTMKRCLALQPGVPRHREQIERFEAGKRGEQRPTPP